MRHMRVDFLRVERGHQQAWYQCSAASTRGFSLPGFYQVPVTYKNLEVMRLGRITSNGEALAE